MELRESAAQVSVKPALKHSGTTNGEKSKHLSWDEHAIEEHDTLRGTRMKIDEPNTPFTHYEHSEDEESTSSGHRPRSPEETKKSLSLAWTALETKLQAVADARDSAVSPAPSRDGSEGNIEDRRRGEEKTEEHERIFKDHRKQHYNEAEALKIWKREHAEDEDDEGDDEGLEGMED